jgi:hypothetical protein
MGFCSKAAPRRLLGGWAEFERYVVDSGIPPMTHRFGTTPPVA